MTTQHYATLLQERLAQNACPENAFFAAKYMRNQFTFFGIKTPQRKELLRLFLKEHGLPSKQELPELLHFLWQMPQRECHYVGIDLLEKFAKQLLPEDLELLNYLLTHQSWWDSVDGINKSVGIFLMNYPHLRISCCQNWLASQNRWLQRISIIFQLSYKQKTDFELLSHTICLLADSNEFFIQKAIGWALRQYGKYNPAAVRHFLETQPLKPLSFREASKYLKN